MTTRQALAEALVLIQPYVFLALAAGFGWLTKLAAAWFTKSGAHLDDAMAAQAMSGLARGAEMVTSEIYQRVVADLKDPAKEGTWTRIAAEAAKASAMADLRSLYQSQIATVAAHLGLGDSATEKLLSGLIEKGVVKLKSMVPQLDSIPVLKGSDVHEDVLPATPPFSPRPLAR